MEIFFDIVTSVVTPQWFSVGGLDLSHSQYTQVTDNLIQMHTAARFYSTLD